MTESWSPQGIDMRYREFELDGLGSLDARSAHSFAIDCAQRTLGIFELALPGDSRPRDAIRMARLYLSGEATLLEVDSARAAAAEASLAAASIGPYATAAVASATAAALSASPSEPKFAAQVALAAFEAEVAFARVQVVASPRVPVGNWSAGDLAGTVAGIWLTQRFAHYWVLMDRDADVAELANGH